MSSQAGEERAGAFGEKQIGQGELGNATRGYRNKLPQRDPEENEIDRARMIQGGANLLLEAQTGGRTGRYLRVGLKPFCLPHAPEERRSHRRDG